MASTACRPGAVELMQRMAGAVLLCVVVATLAAASDDGQCTSRPQIEEEGCGAPAEPTYDYGNVFQRSGGISFADLPGFTRSVYERDYALVTPESRVWAVMPGWRKAVTAHLISKTSGANFAMYLAMFQSDGSAGAPPTSAERFLLVVDGAVTIEVDGETYELATNYFAYFPPNTSHSITSEEGANCLLFERLYGLQGAPTFRMGHVDVSPVLPVPGEVFVLRKLLPATSDYDFNVHVMDFKPGEYLNVKEVHYNQHGLLLLQGQGIYRLANSWHPVQAGDAIWMAPYVVQWYAALGSENSRYILYKDTMIDPLL